MAETTRSPGFDPVMTVDRSPLSIFASLASVAAFLVAAIAVMVTTSSGSAGGTPTATTERTINVVLTEMKIDPPSIDVAPGTTLTLNVANKGTMDHDFKVDGGVGTKMLKPGTGETITLSAVEASTSAWCTVPGHKEAGMVMTVNVTGSAPAHGSAASGSESEATGAKIDFSAKPAEGWKAKDPTAPPTLTGTVHDIALEAAETVLEVAPGVTQEMWTFNVAGEGAAVPGPTLRGKIGDTFRVTLTNKGRVGHSIDFHASKVAWNDEMRTINSGESLVYEFVAGYAGAYMYHCGTSPTLHHIGNGMYGAIIIDPPNLPPVDHEFVVVQSELYTGPEGQPGDLAKMQKEAWDAVVFNGYVNQYLHQPIRVEPNERIRTWVIDDGPSENSAFHIVGTIFDTVWREGTYTLQPDARQGGSQVLDLQPAQGGFVEFSFAEAGLYPMVTHKFANTGKGALGLFQAGEVENAPAGSH